MGWLNQLRWRFVLAFACVALPLAYLSYWAGAPQKGTLAFAVGLVVFLGLMTLFAWLGWRFLVRPLPAGDKPLVSLGLGLDYRHVLAALLAVGTLALMVGGFWDEVWHRKYGLPFGQDLFWRPHLLIYFGLLVPPALAALTLVRVIRDGQGHLTQRLRTDRGTGLLVVLGVFLAVNVPADPVWHRIYGKDISAWSLPHLVLMGGALALAFLGGYFQLSIAPRREAWKPAFVLPPATLVTLVFFATSMSIMAQVMIGDFAPGNPAVLLRPSWLLPSLIASLTLFIGSLANHSTRSYGAATAVGLLTVAARFLLVRAFSFYEIESAAWLPLLPPLVALDVWYGLRARLGRDPAPSPWNATAALAGIAAMLVILPRFHSYLRYDAIGWGVALLACWVAATAATWLGTMAGDFLATAAFPAEAAGRHKRWRSWLTPVAIGSAVVFIAFFITTATPPTSFF